jgi:hypothetical protein
VTDNFLGGGVVVGRNEGGVAIRILGRIFVLTICIKNHHIK